MRPDNYYPSLEGRINYAIANNTDLRELAALIAEAEISFDGAPDRPGLRAVLANLKQTYAQLMQAG